MSSDDFYLLFEQPATIFSFKTTRNIDSYIIERETEIFFTRMDKKNYNITITCGHELTFSANSTVNNETKEESQGFLVADHLEVFDTIIGSLDKH